jgi:hypothetical protein
MRVTELAKYLSIILISFSLSVIAACSSAGADALSGGDESQGGQLQVGPGGPIDLGFFEEQVFDVQLSGITGDPLAGEPISVSLIGPAHNGFVSPFELTSDEEGSGQVVFTAPDTATELEIRFSSPAAEADVVVAVTVDPAELGFTIEVEYDGQRQLAYVEAQIYADATCEDLALGIAGDPADVQTAESIPAGFTFVGLLAGSTYAVGAVGQNSENEPRAEDCLDGLLPDGDGGVLGLTDLPFDVVGVFGVEMAVSTSGALEPAVAELASSLDPFSTDVPDAILDAIRAVIEDEPLIAESFDEIRVTDDLDGLLVADFAARDVDVAGSLSAAWEQVDASLVGFAMSAELEFGAPTDGVYDLYHQIVALSFVGIEQSFLVALPETGQGTASPAVDDIDALLISQHQVGLGLGGPVEFLLEAELAESYGAEGLAGALEEIVDCDAVVTVLAGPLDGVADAAEILAGCQDAMIGAAVLLDEGVALISGEYAQVSFNEGSCRLADPGVGNLVEELIEGEFQVTWEGGDPLGPMGGEFDGMLQGSN